jgi:hypothetical protein
MNKENAHKYLPLVQALADGKTIQHKMSKNWTDIDDHVVIGFYDYPENYRIKPEPRKWVIYINVYTHQISNNCYSDSNWERITVQEVLK